MLPKNRQLNHHEIKLGRKHSKVLLAISAILLVCLASAFMLQNPPINALTTRQSDLESNQSLPVNVIETSQYNPCFDFNVLYAYVGPRTSHFTTGNPLQNETSIKTLNAKTLYPSLVCFNVTSNPINELGSCDAKLEVYLVKIQSNTGLTENHIYFIATNCEPSFKNPDLLNPAISNISRLIDTNTVIDRLNGKFAYNMISDNRSLSGRVGTLGMYNTQQSDNGLWSKGTPSTMTIDVRCLGLITLKGTEVTIIKDTALPTDHKQVSLQGFDEGFAYNNLIPQDQLTKIDPFQPPFP
jgi:hypothetical protein